MFFITESLTEILDCNALYPRVRYFRVRSLYTKLRILVTGKCLGDRQMSQNQGMSLVVKPRRVTGKLQYYE